MIIAALALLSNAAYSADNLAGELSEYTSALRTEVSMENTVLTGSPQLIGVKIQAENPFEMAMPVYLIRESSGEWEFVKFLGGLPADSTTIIELEVEVRYEKQARQKTHYAVVGRGGDGELYGSDFWVEEDWSGYESEINRSLSGAIATYVPIIGTLLVLLISIVGYTAYSSRSPGIKEDEYTLTTLVFPKVAGRPFEEKLADVMINPVMLLAELACVSVLVALMFQGIEQGSGWENALQVMLLSAVGSFTVPFFYFAAAWYFEKREEGKPLRFFAGIFVWGMFAALLSLIISSSVASELKAFMLASYVIVATTVVSPMVEEIMKGLGVLFMSGHHEYNDTLTGLLLGFTCGAGFAFVENWFYFSTKANPFEIGLVSWGTLIVYRSLFNTLAHGCFTAAISTTIGYIRGVPKLRKFARLAFVPGVFLAVVILSIFNISSLADGFVVANREALFFVFNPMLIILLVAMFFLVLVTAVIDEKKRRVRQAAYESAQRQAQ